MSPNVTNTHQPDDMGMISSIKVRYKFNLVDKILCIFDIEGGYQRAYAKRKKKKIGWKGINFGGKPRFLDAMRILKPIKEDDEGKYSRVDGIKCFCRMAIIPSVSWEFDINNDAGRSYVPIIMKTLSKDDCENICNLFETLLVKSKESGSSVSWEAYGLKSSLVSDGYFTKSGIRAMIENWVQVEDDPYTIDAEVDEAIELL